MWGRQLLFFYENKAMVICGTANLIKCFYLDWRSYANWGHIKSVAENTFPLHSSGKTVNDKPRKRQMWDIGWHRGIPIFRIFTFSNVSGKMRPPDIFIASGATKSHFMEVFEKLRIHVALAQILMALSQIGNLMENTVHSWNAWNDSFSFRTFRSYPNVCLCRKELLCGRSQLWHPFAHILCVTPRLHWQMVTSISFMKHNQQTNPKPNHQKTYQLVNACWIFSLYHMIWNRLSHFS